MTQKLTARRRACAAPTRPTGVLSVLSTYFPHFTATIYGRGQSVESHGGGRHGRDGGGGWAEA